MHRLAELEVFVAVVESESFTAAAKDLGVSKSFVSKEIRALEDRLGVRLINRTTRKLALTDAGAGFFARARQIMEDVEAAERSVVQLNTEPRGLLRISVPMTFGIEYVSPALTKFMQSHPDLEIDIAFADRKVDIIDEGFDLVLRIGKLADSSFVVRKIAPVRLMLLASPSYLEQAGTPQRPQDLADHECMQYTYQDTNTWRLDNGDSEVAIQVHGRMRANNGNALRDAAVSGLGIVIVPDFMACNQLADGSLVEVLPGWSVGDRAVWAMYPHSRHLSAKVRLCVDFLAEYFNPVPW